MDNNAIMLDLNDPQGIMAVSPRLARALEDIRKNSVSGRRLVNWLQKQGVGILINPGLKSPGLYDPAVKAIQLHPDKPDYFQEMILHEGFHALQGWRGLLKRSYTQSLREWILQTMLQEAGAISYAAMASYEMKLNGSGAAFSLRCNEPAHEKYMNHLYRVFEQEYRAASAIKDRQGALLDAGNAVFNAVFKCAKLTESYIDTALRTFVDEISASRYARHRGKDAFNMAAMKNYGRIDDERYLSRDFQVMDADKALFSRRGLTEAVEWLEYLRLVNFYKGNIENLDVMRTRNRIEQSGNPFTGITLDSLETAILEEFEKPVCQQAGILDIMQRLSGDESCRQMHFNFSRPARSA